MYWPPNIFVTSFLHSVGIGVFFLKDQFFFGKEITYGLSRILIQSFLSGWSTVRYLKDVSANWGCIPSTSTPRYREAFRHSDSPHLCQWNTIIVVNPVLFPLRIRYQHANLDLRAINQSKDGGICKKQFRVLNIEKNIYTLNFYISVRLDVEPAIYDLDPGFESGSDQIERNINGKKKRKVIQALI